MDMLLIIGVVVVFLLIPIFCVFYLLKFHKNDVKGIIRFNMKLKSDLPSFKGQKVEIKNLLTGLKKQKTNLNK